MTDTQTFPRNIVLVGFMGCGKSTAGRTLAARLGNGWRFVDTDTRLAEVAGCDIPTLFRREGETAFREREAQILSGLSAGEKLVIATGGGAVMHDGNIATLRSAGLVVWLTARVDVIVMRTERREADRPLLAARGDTPLYTHILNLLAGRAPFYQQAAHLIVDTSDRATESIAAEIERKAIAWQKS
ncbi:MAG: shikimate kinase [Armatimonadetes bacterium]|nr:shikimate kinase [Armatimonadota bacterium]